MSDNARLIPLITVASPAPVTENTGSRAIVKLQAMEEVDTWHQGETTKPEARFETLAVQKLLPCLRTIPTMRRAQRSISRISGRLLCTRRSVHRILAVPAGRRTQRVVVRRSKFLPKSLLNI